MLQHDVDKSLSALLLLGVGEALSHSVELQRTVSAGHPWVYNSSLLLDYAVLLLYDEHFSGILISNFYYLVTCKPQILNVCYYLYASPYLECV